MASNQRINYTLGFDADVRAAQQQIKNLVNSLKEIQSVEPIKYDDKDLKQAQKSAAQLANYIKEAYNVDTGKLDLSKFSQQLQKSNRTLKDFAVDFSKLGREGRQAFMELAASINAADTPMFKLNGRLQEFSRTLANTVKWQISSNITHGLESALSNAYHYAQDLNRSLTDIRIVTGYNTDAMADFAKEASKAASNLSVKTTDYTNAALIYYQQGLTESEVQERTNITMKMANVAGVAAETVSDQLTAIWNNFDDGSKSLEYYADVLTRLGADTASSTDEIVQGLQKFAAVSDTIGLSYEYAAAAQTTITDKTRESADVVGTALKTLFSRVQGLKLGETLEDGVDLNKYSAALDSVGISVLDQNNQLKDMDAILDELGAKWDMIGRSEQMALAQTVAGVRQYTQLIALMDNWDNFQLNVARAEGSKGSLDDQFKIYEEGWKAASARLTQSIDNVYDSLINEEFFIKLDNFLTPIINGIAGVIDGFGGFEGILMSVGSLIMTTYAKDVPKVFDKISIYFSQLTKKGRQQTTTMQKDAAELANGGLFGSYSSSDASEADVIQTKGLMEVSRLKTELLNKQDQLNDKEKAEFEYLIQSTEQSYKMVEAKQRQLDLQQQETDEMMQIELSKASTDRFLEELDQVKAEAEKKLEELSSYEYKDDKGQVHRGSFKGKNKTQIKLLPDDVQKQYREWKKYNSDTFKSIKEEWEKYQKYANSSNKQISIDFKKSMADLRAAAENLTIFDGLKTDSESWAKEVEEDAASAAVSIQNQLNYVKDANIFGDQQDVYEQAANELNEALSNTNLDITGKQQAIEKFRQTLANLGATSSFSEDQIQIIKETIRELGIVLGIPDDKIETLIVKIENLGTSSAKNSRNLDALGKRVEELPKHAVSASEAFTTLAGAITGISSIFKQLGNVIENFDDMDTEEKFGAIAGSMGNILTQAIMLIPQLNQLKNGLVVAGEKGVGSGAKLAGAFAKIGGGAKAAGAAGASAGAAITAGFGVFLAIAAAIIAALGTIYLIFKANQKAEQEAYETAKKNADQKKEQLDLIQEEKKENADLLKSMKEQLKIYQETGENKEDLDKATVALCEAYKLEGAALATLSGKYEDYNSLILEATQDQIDKSYEAKRAAEASVAATGTQLLAKFQQIDEGDNGNITGVGRNDIWSVYNGKLERGEEEIAGDIIAKTFNAHGIENEIIDWFGATNVDVNGIDSVEKVAKLYDAMLESMEKIKENAEKLGKEQGLTELEWTKQYVTDSGLYEWLETTSGELKESAEAYKAAKKLLEELDLETLEISVDGRRENIQTLLAEVDTYEVYQKVAKELWTALDDGTRTIDEIEDSFEALISTSLNPDLSGFYQVDKALNDIKEKLKIDDDTFDIKKWYSELSPEEKTVVFEIDFDVITSTKNLDAAIAAVSARYKAKETESNYNLLKEAKNEIKDIEVVTDIRGFIEKYGEAIIGNLKGPNGEIISDEGKLADWLVADNGNFAAFKKALMEQVDNFGQIWVDTAGEATAYTLKSSKLTKESIDTLIADEQAYLNENGRGDWLDKSAAELGQYKTNSDTFVSTLRQRFFKSRAGNETLEESLLDLGFSTDNQELMTTLQSLFATGSDESISDADFIAEFYKMFEQDAESGGDFFAVIQRWSEENARRLTNKGIVSDLQIANGLDETAIQDALGYMAIQRIRSLETKRTNVDTEFTNTQADSRIAIAQTRNDQYADAQSNKTAEKEEEQDPYQADYTPYADIYNDKVSKAEEKFEETLDADIYNVNQANTALQAYLDALGQQASAISKDITYWQDTILPQAIADANLDFTGITSNEEKLTKTTEALNKLEQDRENGLITEEYYDEQKNKLDLVITALQSIMGLTKDLDDNAKAKDKAEQDKEDRAKQAAKSGERVEYREKNGKYDDDIDKALDEFDKTLDDAVDYDAKATEEAYNKLFEFVDAEKKLLDEDRTQYESILNNILSENGITETGEDLKTRAETELDNNDNWYNSFATEDEQKANKEEYEKTKKFWEEILKLLGLIDEIDQKLLDNADILTQAKQSQIDKEKEIKKSVEDTLDSMWDGIDIYAAINRELELSDDLLKAINRKKNQSYGQNYLNALSEENNELNRQNQLLQKKAELAKQWAERETQNLIKQINVYNSTIAKENAALKLSSLMLDEQGNILNYQEILSQAQTYLHELEAQMLVEMSKEAWDAAAKLQTTINMVKDFISGMQASFNAVFDAQDYQIDAANQIADNTAQILANNFEKINYVLELRIKVNDNDLKLIEYQLEKIRDDIYSTVEVGQLLFNGDQSKLNNTLNALKQYETHYNNLESAMSQDLITEEAYYKGLQNTFDGLMDNLQALQDLDEEMRTFYADTLDKAMDEIGKYQDRLSDCTSVLEHYKNLVVLVNGEEDFERIGIILEGQVKTLKNEMDMAVGVYEMLKKEQVAFQAMYDAASPDEQKWLQEGLDAINEQVADAQDEMLSKTEEWAEAMRSVVENKMAQAAKALEDAFTNGMGFDWINSSMDRLSSYQNDFLDEVNTTYELEKLANQARRDADKTNNEARKKELLQYAEAIEKLKDKNQLSKVELEIKQAEYDVLLARLALEEAQNAKSTVRLQRDNEGNFGYVYTSDQEQISAAQQELADATNVLYNTVIDGTNELGSKIVQLEEQLADELAQLQQDRLDGKIATDEEYEQKRAELIDSYTTILKGYTTSYYNVVEEYTGYAKNAWVTKFDDIIEKANDWQSYVTTYTNNCETAYEQYQTSLSSNSQIIQTVLGDTAVAVKGVTDESENLRLKGDEVTRQMGLELQAAQNLTQQYMMMKPQIDALIQSYEALALAIQNTLTLAAMSAEINLEVPGSGNKTNIERPTDLSIALAQTGLNGGIGSEEWKQYEAWRIEAEKAAGENFGNNVTTETHLSLIEAANNGDPVAKRYLEMGINKEIFYDETMAKGILNRADEESGQLAAIIVENIKNGTWTMDMYNKLFGSNKGWIPGIGYYDTGGYTGSWGPEGRLGVLHQKELVLNKDDTSNFLLGINTLRNIVDMIDLSAMNNIMSAGLPSLSAAFGGSAQTLDQHVTIEASFPAVTNHSEIEEAFNNLINTASHYANRKLL